MAQQLPFPQEAGHSLPFPRLPASKEPSQATGEQAATEGQISQWEERAPETRKGQMGVYFAGVQTKQHKRVVKV